LVGTHPESTFKALATRGDWWLAGSRTPAAEGLRRLGYTLADGLEWLNDAVRDKPFRESDDSAGVDPGTTTPWPSAGTAAAATRPPAPDRPTTSAPTDPTPVAIPGVPIPGSDLRWPLPATPHPILVRM